MNDGSLSLYGLILQQAHHNERDSGSQPKPYRQAATLSSNERESIEQPRDYANTCRQIKNIQQAGQYTIHVVEQIGKLIGVECAMIGWLNERQLLFRQAGLCCPGVEFLHIKITYVGVIGFDGDLSGKPLLTRLNHQMSNRTNSIIPINERQATPGK